jgi:peptidoglycan/LPS O-acetylase OafA/YrhL
MTAGPAIAPRAASPSHASKRRPALDGFRGLAILLVITHHALAGRPDDSASAFEWILRGAASTFWVGVDCFFVLSGFLITGILLDTRGRARALRNFLARRVLRTFPLYYAVVFVCFVVLPPIFGEGMLSELSTRQGWFWLHASNFYNVLHNIVRSDGPPVGWMSTFWSLSVEEQFYFAWALTVAIVAPARLWVVALFGLALTLGLRVALAQSSYGDVIYYLTFTRLDALFLGSLLAIWSRHGLGDRRAHVVAARVIFGGAFVAFCFPSVGIHGSSFFGETLRYSLAALLFASLLVLALDADRHPRSLLDRVFTLPPLRACGKYSYAMYMFNKPIIAGVWILLMGTGAPRVLGRDGALLALVTLATLLSLAASFVSWHALEKHCLALKRYFETRAPTESESPSGA